MATKKDSRPGRVTYQVDRTPMPLHESAQLVEVEGPAHKNGFEFSNNKFVGFAACGSHPPVINIPGFPISPGTRPRRPGKIEKNTSSPGSGPKITASLARAIKLLL